MRKISLVLFIILISLSAFSQWGEWHPNTFQVTDVTSRVEGNNYVIKFLPKETTFPYGFRYYSSNSDQAKFLTILFPHINYEHYIYFLR